MPIVIGLVSGGQGAGRCVGNLTPVLIQFCFPVSDLRTVVVISIFSPDIAVGWYQEL